MSELLSLAARVEALSGADREVDGLIASLLGAGQFSAMEVIAHANDAHGWGDPAMCPNWAGTADMFDVPAYTASLDAAVSLVPEGMFARIDFTQPQTIIVRWDRRWEEVSRSLCALTAQNSVTAAALRALAHIPNPEQGTCDE